MTLAVPTRPSSDLSLGRETAQGLVLTTALDVEQNDATKEFSARFKERDGSNPTMVQAGVYSAVLHYLQAVEANGATDADTVMEWTKDNTTKAPILGEGTIREDGRQLTDLVRLREKATIKAKSQGD